MPVRRMQTPVLPVHAGSLNALGGGLPRAEPSAGRSPLGRRSPAIGAALPLFTGGAGAMLEAARGAGSGSKPPASPLGGRGRSRLPASPALAGALSGLGLGHDSDARSAGAGGAAKEERASDGEGLAAASAAPGAAREAAGAEGGGADFFAPAFVNGARALACAVCLTRVACSVKSLRVAARKCIEKTKTNRALSMEAPGHARRVENMSVVTTVKAYKLAPAAAQGCGARAAWIMRLLRHAGA